MIQKGTRLNIVDNSGAKVVECIHIFNRRKNFYGYPGEVIIISVKRLRKVKIVKKNKIKKGQICPALIVATKKEVCRKTGVVIKSKINNAIILNKEAKLPLANRFKSSIWIEVREKGFAKAITMAKGIL